MSGLRDGAIIPSGLLVLGTAIVKREWTPYAVLVAVILSAYKLWSSRTFTNSIPIKVIRAATNTS